jgi:hypothetical protein
MLGPFIVSLKCFSLKCFSLECFSLECFSLECFSLEWVIAIRIQTLPRRYGSGS